MNPKSEDTFHLTIEEYLQSVISLVEELVSASVGCDLFPITKADVFALFLV